MIVVLRQPWRVLTDCCFAVQGIFTYIDTLLPLAYIHMIMFVVKFSVMLLALNAGLISAKAWYEDDLGKIFVQTFILLFIPGIYQGLLSMENDLRNPFGADEIDFPRAAYRTGMFKRHQEYSVSAKDLPFHDKDCSPDAPEPKSLWFNKEHAGKVDGDDPESELVPASAVAMHQERISSLENENKALRLRMLDLTHRSQWNKQVRAVGHVASVSGQTKHHQPHSPDGEGDQQGVVAVRRNCSSSQACRL